MKMQYIRHATILLEINNQKILIDPLLSDPGTLPPIPLTSNKIKNPLIKLPCDKYEIVNNIDAVLVTHAHTDHFDNEAEKLIPKNCPIFCQPEDVQELQKKGFMNTIPVITTFTWNNITFTRRRVNHAKGILLSLLGKSSSYLLEFEGNTLFLTGDTIYDDNLQSILKEMKPKYVIANAGSAQMKWGEPITLTKEAILSIKNNLPESDIYAVHMDAYNHCELTKKDLRSYINEKEQTIFIPNEGEIIQF
jgi:L-ascorbate metabolism protein UlaG (beta-lactamase superfamily)